MEHASEALLLIFIVFVAAQVGAELAQRMRLPAVVGEIAAGVIVGPHALGWIRITEPLEMLAEIGAVLLLFSVGIETSLKELKKVGLSAIVVGASGVCIPFIAGALWAWSSGYPSTHAAFIGAAFVATSAGITAKVLQDLGVLDRIESRIILAAAVVDDILAMLLLGVVTALASGGEVSTSALAIVALQALAFVGLIALVGTRVMRSSSQLLDVPINPLSPLTLSLALCMGLAVCASYVGLAAIIGAFLAGMIMAESQQRHSLEKQIQPILAFVVPYFFVVTGARVDLHVLLDMKAAYAVLIVTLLAFFSKFIGCGAGALKLGRKSAAIIGVGMAPRGEVGIIVAGLGLTAGVISNDLYSVLIAMSLLTSIAAPPILKMLLSDSARPDTL